MGARGAARRRSRPPRRASGTRARCGSETGRAAPPGSGNVPSCSIMFSVAITRNGSGRACVTPSTVTWCSAIASRRADCALGSARLTSSTRSTLREHRAGLELELARARVPDREAGDVGRLEVRRALDPRGARALRSTPRASGRGRSSLFPARPRAGRGPGRRVRRGRAEPARASPRRQSRRCARRDRRSRSPARPARRPPCAPSWPVIRSRSEGVALPGGTWSGA